LEKEKKVMEKSKKGEDKDMKFIIEKIKKENEK
jgi:hypothetical protein